MTRWPSVSVVTISFSDPDGLTRTVDSVAGLKYDGVVEHIVIDGGSGPHVEQFLTDHDARLAYWQSCPDGGRYAAMNIGTAHSSGDVVWFMNSGDTFAGPDSLSVAAAAFSAVGWGYGQVRRVDADGGDHGVWDATPFRVRRFAAGVAAIPHQGAFFGAELLARVSGYDESFGLGADQLLMLRCAREATPREVPHVVCDFDITGAGSIRSMADHFDDVRRGLEAVDYWPYSSRLQARIHVRWSEWVARAKLGARAVLAGR